MAKGPKKYYECQTEDCGYHSINNIGKCPNCQEFGTFKEVIEREPTVKKNNRMTSSDSNVSKLKDILASNTSKLIVTGINEFDRVIGGGIISDSVNVLTAPPGAGKSTLLLEVAQKIAEQGKNVLYIAGEESESQIKLRATRILVDISDNIYIKAETNLENIMLIINKIKPTLLIIDSIQMLFSLECDGSLGGDKQLLYCSSTILNKAKNSTFPISVFFVAQVTKDDELRGSREFEHMIDAVFTLTMEDDSGILRMLKSTKNRFGDVSEVGLFEMNETGLIEIANPNKYFITSRTIPVSGSAISAIKEGTRTIAVEVNTLTETNNFTYPSRISQGINRDFLQILLAVMDNKLSCNVKKKDVYVQTSNGIRVKDTSIGLAVIASIYSSVNNIPIDNDTAFLGEVSLTGEIKKIPNIDRIIGDFERMGFKKIIIPKNNKLKTYKIIEIVEIENVSEIKSIIDK